MDPLLSMAFIFKFFYEYNTISLCIFSIQKFKVIILLYFFKQEFSEKENLTPPTTPYYNQRALTHLHKDRSNDLSNTFQTPPRQTNRLDPKHHLKKALSLALIHS